MCGSIVDIQCEMAEIRRGKKTERKIEETTGQNIMAALLHRAAIKNPREHAFVHACADRQRLNRF